MAHDHHHDSDPPASEEKPKEKPNKLKDAAALIAAVTALVAAFGAYMKPQDTKATKNSYETLAGGLKQLQDESRRNHDDISALRGFVEGYVRADSPGLPGPRVPMVAPMPMPSAEPVSSEPAASSRAIHLPPQHAKPVPWKAPPFAEIEKK